MGPASKRARPAAEVLVIDDSDDEAPPQAAEAALNSFKQPPAAAVAANGHDAQEEEGGYGIGGAGALTTALAFEAVHQARLLEQCRSARGPRRGDGSNPVALPPPVPIRAVLSA